MACDLPNVSKTPGCQKSGGTTFFEHEVVVTKPPAHTTWGAVIDGEPLVLDGARCWRVAWVVAGGQCLPVVARIDDRAALKARPIFSITCVNHSLASLHLLPPTF
jgi:hypothetical protein